MSRRYHVRHIVIRNLTDVKEFISRPQKGDLKDVVARFVENEPFATEKLLLSAVNNYGNIIPLLMRHNMRLVKAVPRVPVHLSVIVAPQQAVYAAHALRIT